jgi:hypothetical protein
MELVARKLRADLKQLIDPEKWDSCVNDQDTFVTYRWIGPPEVVEQIIMTPEQKTYCAVRPMINDEPGFKSDWPSYDRG